MQELDQMSEAEIRGSLNLISKQRSETSLNQISKIVGWAMRMKKVQLEIYARCHQCQMLYNLKRQNDAIAMFPKLLMLLDEHDSGYRGFILWNYRRTIHALQLNSKITLEAINNFAEDYIRRAYDYGCDQKHEAYVRLTFAHNMVQTDRIDDYLRKYNSLKKRNITNIDASEDMELYDILCALLHTERYSDLIALAPKIIEEPKFRNANTWHPANSLCLESCLMLGNMELAAKYEENVFTHTDFKEHNPNISEVLLSYYSILNSNDRATMIIKNQSKLYDRFNDYGKWAYTFGLGVYFNSLENDEPFKDYLLPMLDLIESDSGSDYSKTFLNECKRLAKALDERNQNDYYQNYVAKRLMKFEEIGLN
ncbi:MAG: hypothetical protein MRY83_23170 [Flavobacteriales bacterium]|nr:hypothetical protein [Flavobacteriales bacterium]